jgi:hypothetical protein
MTRSQAPVSRYMPRRGYPPTQTWRTFLRNQAFAIGTIGLGEEAGRLSDELLALIRGWIERVVRCVTKVRNGIPCASTLHPCRQIALPILLIGATLIVVPRQSFRRPPH